VHLLVANTLLQGIVGNCLKSFKTRNRKYWNFKGNTFVPSVNKKHEKYAKSEIINTKLI